MKIKLLLLFLWITLSTQMQAQAPGYMGKKLMMGFIMNYSPALSAIAQGNNINIDYNGDVRNMFLSPLRIGGSMKYVITERKIVGLSISYQKTGVMTATEDNSDQQNSITNGNPFSYSRSAFTTIGISLSATPQSTAPVGFYFGQSLLMIMGNIEAVDTKNNVYTVDAASLDFGYVAEFGYRRVAWDKVVIEAGFDLAFYGKGFISSFMRTEAASYADRTIYQACFKNYANNLLSLKLGVYYLL
jgi:hypothetical protein